MKQLKTLTFVAALSMLAAVSCKKDEKKDAPAAAEKTVEAAEPETAAEPAVADGEKADAMSAINGMVAGCDASADARAKRQAAKPLYERLGGHDPIMAVTLKIIELHKADDSPIKGMFEKTDVNKLAEHVVDFVGAGTGGPEKYTGKNMKDAHVHLKLTPEQLLAAGEDIMQALASFKVPAEETEEFMCIILSFKDDLLAAS
jgi:hemoglobin